MWIACLMPQLVSSGARSSMGLGFGFEGRLCITCLMPQLDLLVF